MGEIAVKHGFYGTDGGDPAAPAYSGSSECLIIADADPGELWVFNILTGKNNASAIWAAQKIPDNHVTVLGNAFSIRRMNLSDSENFLYSPGISDLALEMGWWTPSPQDPPEIFDFFGAYGWDVYTPTTSAAICSYVNMSSEFLRNVLSYYAGRRMWRVFSLLSPEEGAKLDPNTGHLPDTQNPYPVSVSAAPGSVTLQMVMDTHRDHYEGTPYDLTKGMAAGPHGNPNRGWPTLGIAGQWERAIGMFRTCWSFLLEAKPKWSVTWFGWDAAHGTAYLPLFAASSDRGPESFHSISGHMSKFSHEVAFWAFNFVNQYQDLNFQLINADVRKRAHQIEKDAQRLVEMWSAEADKIGVDEAARKCLTQRSNAFAQKTVGEWWDFAYSLMAKYGHYVVTHNESTNGELVHGAGSQEFPIWWLSSPEVGFTSWTPSGPYGVLNGGGSDLGSVWTLSSVSPLNALFLGLFSVLSAAVIAYHVGIHQGKRKQDHGAYYLVQP